jgi:cobyrinic acid a,c-diamide synthase
MVSAYFGVYMKESRPRIVISASHRSSGKSTISIGICAALREAGHVVHPFKKGPDYIDPMWLTAASGRECRNLDFFMMGPEAMGQSFSEAGTGADVSVIEGNMGLYDGLDLKGSDSTAALSRLLKAPTILVVNARRMTRGVAPLVLGYQKFEPETRIAGVVLNRVRGVRHEKKLREALDYYCGIEVVGAIPDQEELFIEERHLGLTPLNEDTSLHPVIARISTAVKESVDLDRVMEIAASAPVMTIDPGPVMAIPEPHVRIGIASDPAFTFYYPENLEALALAGAELVPFNTLKDDRLPEVQGLYLGGGFPEIYMEELERNGRLRDQIRSSVEAGMPVYAECGGLMYLARSISFQGKKSAMAGVLPCDVEMYDRPMGHGYVKIENTGNGPWPLMDETIQAHEFHHSKVVNLENVEFAYRMARGYGVDGKHDGILYKNVLASYAHLHSSGTPAWANGFVTFVNRVNYGG